MRENVTTRYVYLRLLNDLPLFLTKSGVLQQEVVAQIRSLEKHVSDENDPLVYWFFPLNILI